MNRGIVLQLAEEAGAMIFNEPLHEGIRIVIADHKASGDGSDFIFKFAQLIEQYINQDHEFEGDK